MEAFPKLIILGSSSKFRRKVVSENLGPTFNVETLSPDIDEKAIRRDTAEDLVEALSRAKADAVRSKLSPAQLLYNATIITGDQVVRFKGEIREKPISPEENAMFLQSYRNSTVEVVTGLCVDSVKTGRRMAGVEVERVTYGSIPDDVVAAVMARGDSAHCCGGLVVEDPDLSKCIVSMEGTLDAIMGLPVALLLRLMKEVEETQ